MNLSNVRLHHVSLLVSAMDECLRFYIEVFGFKELLVLRELNGRRIIHLKAPLCTFVLELIEGNQLNTSDTIHLGFTSTDFDLTFETIKALGIEIVRGPIRVGAEQIVFIKDPSGYLIEINDGIDELL